MSVVTLNWQEFLQEATEFQKLSERLGDNWILHSKNDEEGNTYLIYEQKLPNTIDTKDPTDLFEDRSCYFENENAVALKPNHELLKVEYHILYSISYQVPVLYFRIYRNDGSLVSLKDCWRIYRISNTNSNGIDVTGGQANTDMLNIMTQMDHPVLHKPYIAIHPCRTSELLSQAGISRNRVVTFISLMGPYVQLVLRNEYGVPFAKN